MTDVITVCKTHDIHKPNFIQEAIAAGKIDERRVGHGYQKNMTEEELQFISHYEDKYYRENWQRVIMRILRYKKPLVANSHKFSAETLINLEQNPNQKVYCHFNFVRPGHQIYAISHQDPDRSLFDEHQKTFYAHDMLATLRDEKVPSYELDK